MKDMYLSTGISLIKQALHYYACKPSRANREKEMESNKIDAYALVLGEFEATFCASISISYIFKMTGKHFYSSAYKGIY
eukprot:826224-Ditylum_brightwellii.AAC.1